MDQALANAPIRPNPWGDWPRIDESAYVDPSAQIIGKVAIGPRAFVAPGAVIRADEKAPDGSVAPVEIGADCNIQDCVIVHSGQGAGIVIGDRVSLAHGCVVHGPAFIADDCFLGIRSAVINATLEEGVWAGVGAVILEITIPSHTFATGGTIINSTDKVARLNPINEQDRTFQQGQVTSNQLLNKGYLALRKS